MYIVHSTYGVVNETAWIVRTVSQISQFAICKTVVGCNDSVLDDDKI